MAILCLSHKASYHIPQPSVDQIVIPEGNNTAFYIDETSWAKLVESLNNKYTSHLKKLEDYEKQFIRDGKSYLETAKKISEFNLKNLSNAKISSIYQDYQNKLFRYSVFAWTSFILNNYVAERAIQILDKYIKKEKREAEREDIIGALFHPQKKAAILQLQYEVENFCGKLSRKQFSNLYERFKWLSCLDIHNKPWTKDEFEKHIQSFGKSSKKKTVPFGKYASSLKINPEDLDYLLMAQKFVYIKDARDDFRRQGVYFARNLFTETARRMAIKPEETTYLQENEIVSFLSGKSNHFQKLISERKKGFVLYLDTNKKLVCLQGKDITKVLSTFHLLSKEEEIKEISGTVASKGKAIGIVTIIRGVKDLEKVKEGNILVAVTTHPDYVPAMRIAAAIITDEGGITSHAAIVSREFGIPCIVGTKNATRVLHDGDKVEVDAIAGAGKVRRKK
ncbi:hypothetical protein HY945_01125 [Candidatus Gottesmanbacteria bacterium]|nr:hypothetical protein [Candidatus Gottesmanbacteria bacterium]